MTIAILDVPEDIISIGDTIAVFFNDGKKNKCGGFVIWDDNRVALSVWGNDSTTEEKYGFSFQEKMFNNKIFSYTMLGDFFKKGKLPTDPQRQNYIHTY